MISWNSFIAFSKACDTVTRAAIAPRTLLNEHHSAKMVCTKQISVNKCGYKRNDENVRTLSDKEKGFVQWKVVEGFTNRCAEHDY